MRSTLALRRAAVAAEGGDFVLLQEGFASTAEVHASSRNGKILLDQLWLVLCVVFSNNAD